MQTKVKTLLELVEFAMLHNDCSDYESNDTYTFASACRYILEQMDPELRFEATTFINDENMDVIVSCGDLDGLSEDAREVVASYASEGA